MTGRRLLTIGLATLILAGCGQKGPLFKAPEQEAAAVQNEQPAAAPENDKPDDQGAAE
ncbi:LPS translocon maturation chaperone LptM [Marinobacter sp. 1Y8]